MLSDYTVVSRPESFKNMKPWKFLCTSVKKQGNLLPSKNQALHHKLNQL